ncbi:MAG: outer membrane lipoprotein-sorting protein [Proteobacteria bacterium]|nr:outer membrane lipoprotein-sorting protein [Pseudomonadota bacterium]
MTMLFRINLAALLAAALVLTGSATLAKPLTKPLTARRILDGVDDLFRGDSSRGRMTMIITTRHWKRTLTLEFWSKGKTMSLVRILAPQREKGTATLRVGKNLWNYLPKVKRVIKLSSSMMSASWMGSHFTNDDLVRESRMADDYTYRITFRGRRAGREVVDLTCIPKRDAAVVWGKVVVTVRTRDYLPLLIRYFDEDLKPARSMTFSRVADLGGRRLPTVMTVVPADKPGEATVVRYEKMKFNLGLSDDLFSLRNLQR